MSNGKGDRPRNCFSKQFKDNYDQIDWGRKKLGKSWDEFTQKVIDAGLYDCIEIISDGYQTWSAKCPNCNQLTMEVVRPGKVQCSNCS